MRGWRELDEELGWERKHGQEGWGEGRGGHVHEVRLRATYGDWVGGLADTDDVALSMDPLFEEGLLGHGDAQDPCRRGGERGYPG